jgi:hypothetical protein
VKSRGRCPLSRIEGKGQLLNPKLVFETAWFWTLPEVHDVQEESSKGMRTILRWRAAFGDVRQPWRLPQTGQATSRR